MKRGLTPPNRGPKLDGLEPDKDPGPRTSTIPELEFAALVYGGAYQSLGHRQLINDGTKHARGRENLTDRHRRGTPSTPMRFRPRKHISAIETRLRHRSTTSMHDELADPACPMKGMSRKG